MGRHDEEYDGDDDERYGDGYVHELHYDAGKKNSVDGGWRRNGDTRIHVFKAGAHTDSSFFFSWVGLIIPENTHTVTDPSSC